MYMAYKFIHSLFYLYFILLTVDILASWVPEFNESKVVSYVRKLTQPYLSFFRGIIPPLGMVDVSPIVAFIALHFIESLVLRIIF
jgi:YggT family protein